MRMWRGSIRDTRAATHRAAAAGRRGTLPRRCRRPTIDEYADYLFTVLHFARFDKHVGRLNAAELDIFVGPHFLITLPNEPIDAVEYVFERCRASEEMRDQYLSKGPGYLLYKIVD